jgi:putative membrane protein
MGLRRLLVAGLFNFSLVYLVVIAGAFQYLEPLVERNEAALKALAAPTRAEAARYGIYITALLILVLLLFGVLTGLIRTIARDFRYRLARAPAGLRRRRGLFTLSEVVIPLRRVQVAIVETGWLRRIFGWCSLQFQTLGTDPGQSGHQDVAPFARRTEIVPLLSEIGIGRLPDDDAYHRVSRLTIARRWLAEIVPLVCVVLLGAIFVPAVLLLCLPLSLLGGLAVLQWRRHRYLLADGALYVREGILKPRLWIVPFARLQSLSVRRGPLQRRFGLATLEIDTAGASVFRAPSVRDLERGAAEHLASHLMDEYRRARRDARQP